MVNADDLVCVTCGYFERYLKQREVLALIKEQWSHVEPQEPAVIDPPRSDS